MKMKKIIAKDMKEALRVVRETLGPDAMILTTQKTNEGVEVTAALEDAPKVEQFNEKIMKTPAEGRPSKSITITDPAFDLLREELHTLKHIVQEELGHFAYQDVLNRHPVQAMVYEKLLQMNLDHELAKNVSFQINEKASLPKAILEASDLILSRLQQSIKAIHPKVGCFVFSGLAGSGKSSSLAAFALNHRLQDSKQRIRLVNYDYDKVAGHEPLKTYAKILNAEYMVCEDDKALKKFLQATDSLTLIDASLENCIQSAGSLSHSNVMPAFVISALHSFMKAEKLNKLTALNLFKLAVITHFDDASSLGAATSMMINAKLIPWFSLKNAKSSPTKKIVFFDEKNWIDALFQDSFEKLIQKQTLKKGVA